MDLLSLSAGAKTVCHICGLELQIQYSLKRHIAEVHVQPRRFFCDKCPKSFKRNEHLKEHIAVRHLNISREDFRLNKKKGKTKNLPGEMIYRKKF